MTLSPQTVSARRQQARRREIVDRLLPVVEARMRELGSYANLRVDDLLPDALLSRSTFYRYFQDKNELLIALAEPVFHDVRTAAIRPWERRTAPTQAELQAELRHTFDLYLPHLPVINALVEASYAAPSVRALYEGGFAEVQQAVDSIVALLYGEASDLSTVALDMAGVPAFNRRVYEVARSIPPGETLTYGEVAARLGERGAARAVGRALGQNPFALIVPCHRVLAAGGGIGGFSAGGGVTTKRRLLTIEDGGRSTPLFRSL